MQMQMQNIPLRKSHVAKTPPTHHLYSEACNCRAVQGSQARILKEMGSLLGQYLPQDLWRDLADHCGHANVPNEELGLVEKKGQCEGAGHGGGNNYSLGHLNVRGTRARQMTPRVKVMDSMATGPAD